MFLEERQHLVGKHREVGTDDELDRPTGHAVPLERAQDGVLHPVERQERLSALELDRELRRRRLEDQVERALEVGQRDVELVLILASSLCRDTWQ
ncbi:MAG: hypothetical protein ACJ8GN_19555 [Longimicrobiaceae bacterium]